MKSIIGAVIGLLLVVTCGSSYAADRHALVIGNTNYTVNPLQTPRNDALDMATELAALGYQIHGGGALLDADLDTFEKELFEFAVNLPNESTAIVYFAGHGVMHDADNFLIPIDYTSGWRKSRLISLKDMTQLLELHNPDGLNILLLDACRDNSLLGDTNSRGLSRGLGRIGGARGSFIGYAAEEGKVALESNAERNGFYTGALLAELRESSNVPIQILHNRVAARVIRKSSNEQWPTSYDRTYGEFCIGDCSNGVIAPTTGRFTIQTEPKDAKVCFYLDDWVCGDEVNLPIGDEYRISATAQGYENYQKTVELIRDGQQLDIELSPISSLTVTKTQPTNTTQPTATNPPIKESRIDGKTIGLAAVAILVVGALLSSGGSGGGDPDPNTVNINIPTLDGQ